MSGGYNIEVDGNRTYWGGLKSDERIAREDAERMRLLNERIRKDAEGAARNCGVGAGRPASITADQVRVIRNIRAAGTASLRELAEIVGLSVPAIGQIAKRQSHRGVSDEMTPGAEECEAGILLRVQALRAESATPARPAKPVRPPCPYCGDPRAKGRGSPKTCGKAKCIEAHWRYQGTRLKR